MRWRGDYGKSPITKALSYDVDSSQFGKSAFAIIIPRLPDFRAPDFGLQEQASGSLVHS